MVKKIDTETRAQITDLYLSDDSMTYAKVAKHFGIAKETACRIVREELKAGSGIKPDRREKKEPVWIEHITPIHRKKQELESTIEHKKAELEKALQEYRDFMATIKELLEVKQ